VDADNTDIAHIAAEGEATAVDFQLAGAHHFDSLLGNDWDARLVLLNMERVSYIDSSAIGWLITAQRSFRNAGGRLVLHSLAPAVRNVLQMLKFERVVPLAPTADAGRALLREQAAIAG
jgi:anti-anti-sigma factor